MTRRQIRENIFKILFRAEFISSDDMKDQIEYAVDGLENADIELFFEEEDTDKNLDVTEENLAYIKEKSEDILNHLSEIDAIIKASSEGWKINRLGKSELAILRLAVYEIKFDADIPEGVAINEAVELAKIYCDDSAKGFVNAVLGKIVKNAE